MPYTILTIVEGDEGDGLLYPRLADDDSVLREEGDGRRADRFRGTNLTARLLLGPDRFKNLAESRKVKADVIVTMSRVAVSCAKFDKGGGWVPLGGIASGVVALGLNAGSKLRAAKRSRNKVLVGHVRYPWLAYVGRWSNAVLRAQTLRLGVVVSLPNNGSGSLLLDIGLPMSVNIDALALSIAQQAAFYHLHYSPLPDEARRVMLALTTTPPPMQVDPKGGFSGYRIPWCLPVSTESAVPSVPPQTETGSF